MMTVKNYSTSYMKSQNALGALDGWQYSVEPEPWYEILGCSVGRYDPLFWLARAAYFIERTTAIPANEAAALILYGKKPKAVRGTIHTQHFSHSLPASVFMEREGTGATTKFDRDEVVVTFKTPDLTKDELGKLYDYIRERWSRVKSRPLPRGRITEADEMLHAIVRELDARDEKDAASVSSRPSNRRPGFWERVHGEWLKRGGRQTATPRSLAVQWTQLRKKLFPSSPKTSPAHIRK